MRRQERTECMSVRDALRAGVCRQLMEGKLSESEAAGRLSLSTRQVRRHRKRVREEGERGVIHRSRGRESAQRTPEATREKVVALYRETYSAWNMEHLKEHLASAHEIELSREALRQILLDEESRPRRRRGKRHHKWRERRSREGELVQWDTSLHRWFGADGEEAVLILGVDDATSKILWAEFFEHDGVLENLAVLRSIVRKYGLFESVYADGTSKFFLTDEDLLAARERGEEGLTQFGRVMKTLGIGMIRALSPQAKGRVERAFRTLQDRLIKELALYGIRTRRDGNRYLRRTFIPHYNRRFGVAAADSSSSWVNAGPLDEPNVFCLRETRTVQNDLTISVEGERWQLHGGIRSGERVELRTRLDGSVHIYKKDQELEYHRIIRLATVASG
jgi:transposase